MESELREWAGNGGECGRESLVFVGSAVNRGANERGGPEGIAVGVLDVPHETRGTTGRRKETERRAREDTAGIGGKHWSPR